MKAQTLFEMTRSGRLALYGRLVSTLTPLYRLAFLAAAGRAGLLRLLADGPVAEGTLLARLARDPALREDARVWLEFGVKVGELYVEDGAYGIRGSLAKSLAREENDDVLALVEEAAFLHLPMIRDLPDRLAEGRRATLADQDGPMIARSSRTLEPLVLEVVRELVPRAGRSALLEVGCGSAIYMRAALEQNPELTALGLELQPEVAALARQNLDLWGLAERARVENVDVRQFASEAVFDLATLHNNIYYFPTSDRVALLTHLRGLLQPGGRLLVTSACKGGTTTMSVLDLWASTTEGCGPLPDVLELVEQMKDAGFRQVGARNLLPGDRFFAFLGTAG